MIVKNNIEHKVLVTIDFWIDCFKCFTELNLFSNWLQSKGDIICKSQPESFVI